MVVDRPAWARTSSVCQEARKMASNGLTVAQIAYYVGIMGSDLIVKHNQGITYEVI
jgi:hypothetical protein